MAGYAQRRPVGPVIAADQDAAFVGVDGLSRAEAEDRDIAQAARRQAVEAAAEGLRGVFKDAEAGQQATQGRNVGADAVQVAGDDGPRSPGPRPRRRGRIQGQGGRVHGHSYWYGAQASDGSEPRWPVDRSAEHLVARPYPDDLQSDAQGIGGGRHKQHRPAVEQQAEGLFGGGDRAAAEYRAGRRGGSTRLPAVQGGAHPADPVTVRMRSAGPGRAGRLSHGR
jgi:hypothetical protein